MPIRNALTERLGLAHPIIQAPMAGSGTTPALVAAVCEAGGTGFLGAAYMSPDQIGEACHTVRSATNRPFGVNLFAPTPAPGNAAPDKAMAAMARYHAELGLPPPEPPSYAGDPFEVQFEALLNSGVAAFSFTFGVPSVDQIAAANAAGIMVIGTATTVEEAVTLERAGVDAIATQGAEAGGHRGTFLVDFEAGLVGTMALVPQVVDAVSVPVIAAGGIMDGRGIAAALALGASAVQMGTAFLTCAESASSEPHRRALLAAGEHQTRVTRAFSGRPARGIANRFMDETEAAGDGAILDYPLQNSLTRPARNAAAKQDRAEFLSLWSGQGVRMARRQGAGELVARLAAETDAALARLAALR